MKIHLIDVDADGDTGKVACKQRNVPRDRRVGYSDTDQVTCERCKRALQAWRDGGQS